MSSEMPALRTALFLKAVWARRIEMNEPGKIAVAACLLVLAVALDGGGFVTAMVMWLLCF